MATNENICHILLFSKRLQKFSESIQMSNICEVGTLKSKHSLSRQKVTSTPILRLHLEPRNELLRKRLETREVRLKLPRKFMNKNIYGKKLICLSSKFWSESHPSGGAGSLIVLFLTSKLPLMAKTVECHEKNRFQC